MNAKAVRRLSYEEWEARERARDPNWDRGTREFEKRSGTNKKLVLLLDENIERDLVDELRAMKAFRVAQAPKHTDDVELWRRARVSGWVLVTGDGSDFWNDRKFPLGQSPGLIVLSGRNSAERAEALAVALMHWDIRKIHSLVDAYPRGMKIRASRDGTNVKFWNGQEMIVTSTGRKRT